MPKLSLLSPAIQARIRYAVNSALPDTCSIQQVSRTPGGATGQVVSWTTISSPACRFVANGSERDSDRGINSLDGADSFIFAFDTVIDPSNRILFGGHTYEIKIIVAGHSWEMYRQVDVLRVDTLT